MLQRTLSTLFSINLEDSIYSVWLDFDLICVFNNKLVCEKLLYYIQIRYLLFGLLGLFYVNKWSFRCIIHHLLYFIRNNLFYEVSIFFFFISSSFGVQRSLLILIFILLVLQIRVPQTFHLLFSDYKL